MTFTMPERLLMGPGPSNVSGGVLAALAQPTVGHLDPAFSDLLDTIKDQIRQAMATQNAATFPVSAPASSAMEMMLNNLLEPGDRMLSCVNGVFGGRLAEMARRAGAEVDELPFEWGTIVDPQRLREHLKTNSGYKVIGFVHGETSTGVLSPAAEIAQVIRDAGAMVMMDTVTSFVGTPVLIDEWGIDAVYTGTQKCLSAPPGLAPISFGERAIAAIQARKSPCRTWFGDLSLILNYWSGDGGRTYHHTAPVNALYGLHVALSEVLNEGLESVWQRHREHHQELVAALGELGIELHVADQAARLPQLNAVRIPDGVDDAKVRGQLLNDYGIEIGGGLGPLAGKIWRIGLMGNTCQSASVQRLSEALREVLP